MLQKRGIAHSGSARKRKLGAEQVDDTSPTKQKKTEMQLPVDTTELSSPATVRKTSSPKNDIPGLHLAPQLISHNQPYVFLSCCGILVRSYKTNQHEERRTSSLSFRAVQTTTVANAYLQTNRKGFQVTICIGLSSLIVTFY